MKVIEEAENWDFTIKITKSKSARVYYKQKLIAILSSLMSAYELAKAITYALIKNDIENLKKEGVEIKSSDPYLEGIRNGSELLGCEIALELAKELSSVKFTELETVKENIKRINDEDEEYEDC